MEGFRLIAAAVLICAFFMFTPMYIQVAIGAFFLVSSVAIFIVGIFYQLFFRG